MLSTTTSIFEKHEIPEGCMRFETVVQILVDKKGSDYRLLIDYKVVQGKYGQIVDVFNIWHRPFRLLFDAEWFSDVCPKSVWDRLNREMIEEWNEAHQPTGEQVAAKIIDEGIQLDSTVSELLGVPNGSPRI